VRSGRLVAGLAVATLLLGGCALASGGTAPRCEPGMRLAILAQSVPDAAYVPCISELPAGWTFEGLQVDDGGGTITLESDRADREIRVRLRSSCDTAEATPITPSDDGVRTYHRVDSIDPRYAGQLLDVFPGGCVTVDYDFERGRHVALVTELQAAVDLFTRLELRQALAGDLDVRLDP